MSDHSSPATSSKRRTFHAIAAAATLGFLGKASAQGIPSSGGFGGRGDMAAMAERRIDHLIKLVNGSPEQKAKLLQLAQGAMKDMQPMREQLMAARKRGMALLSSASIDRGAIEKLRGESVQLLDGISRRMSAHMMDAAEVLTPAQRTIVADSVLQRGERGGGHRGGHGGGFGGGWFR